MSGWLVGGERVVDWRGAIGELILLHQHIRDLDHEGLWANELPGVAARPESIVRVERGLGCELDSALKAFLLCADGWRALYQRVDLFGTEDMLGEPMRLAEDRIAELDRAHVLRPSGFAPTDLLPIAMTRSGHGTGVPDLFTVVRSNHRCSGQVLWFADEEVDRFRDFDAFYLAMLDYNREEIKELAAEAQDEGRVV